MCKAGIRLKKGGFTPPIFHTCSQAQRQNKVQKMPLSRQARSSKKAALRHQFFARAARPKAKQGAEFSNVQGRHEVQKGASTPPICAHAAKPKGKPIGKQFIVRPGMRPKKEGSTPSIWARAGQPKKSPGKQYFRPAIPSVYMVQSRAAVFLEVAIAFLFK